MQRVKSESVPAVNEHEVSSDTQREQRAIKEPGLGYHLVVLIGVTFGCWLMVACGAWLMVRPWVVLGSGVAALLCLFPGVLVLFVAHQLAIDEAHKTLMLTVGGSFLRLVFVLGGGLALYNSFSELTIWTLVVWLVPFYVITLLVESRLLLAALTCNKD